MNIREERNDRQTEGFWLGFFVMVFVWPIGVFLFVVGTNIFLNVVPSFSAMGGEGRVVQKIDRRGEKSGLWVKLENGTEIRLPSKKRWQIIAPGDHIRKKKYSAIYTINDVDYNMLMDLAQISLDQGLFICLIFSILVPFVLLAEFGSLRISHETLLLLLQWLCRSVLGGVFLGIATHVRLYNPLLPGNLILWTCGLSIAYPIYILILLVLMNGRLVRVQGHFLEGAFRNALAHLSRWNQLVLVLGVLFGGIFALSFAVPTALLPAPRSFQSLSVLSIWGYSFLLLFLSHVRWTYLEWLLTQPSIAGHKHALMVAAKMRESSAIQPLLDELSVAEGIWRERIVAALKYIGDVRTLFPLLNLLEDTPRYAQEPLKKAVQNACNAIHAVTFGTVPNSQFIPHHTLANYDFSQRSLPLRRLKRIGIGTLDYDFAQVERFLTYAVSAIGQRVLKRHVSVEVYGDAQQLHPNIRNNLTNLCKHVRYDEQRRQARQEEAYS